MAENWKQFLKNHSLVSSPMRDRCVRFLSLNTENVSFVSHCLLFHSCHRLTKKCKGQSQMGLGGWIVSCQLEVGVWVGAFS